MLLIPSPQYELQHHVGNALGVVESVERMRRKKGSLSPEIITLAEESIREHLDYLEQHSPSEACFGELCSLLSTYQKNISTHAFLAEKISTLYQQELMNLLHSGKVICR